MRRYALCAESRNDFKHLIFQSHNELDENKSLTKQITIACHASSCYDVIRSCNSCSFLKHFQRSKNK